MTRRAHFIVIVSAFLGVAMPLRAAEGDHPPQLVQVLSLIDVIPDRDALITAGADEDGAILMQIATDESLPRYTRVRAVHALALFPSPGRTGFLSRLAFEPTEDREVRIAATSTLGRELRLERFPEVDATLVTLLADQDDEIRSAVIRAARRLQPDRARPILEEAQRLIPADRAGLHVEIEQALEALDSGMAPHTDGSVQ